MNYIYSPSEDEVKACMSETEPLIVAIAFDGSETLIGTLEEGVEHHILLMKCGRSSLDLDKYFRFYVDDKHIEWTFACPPNYKNIGIEGRRITQYYKDGFDAIIDFKNTFGCDVGIDIPSRYRYQLKLMSRTTIDGKLITL